MKVRFFDEGSEQTLRIVEVQSHDEIDILIEEIEDETGAFVLWEQV